MNNADRWEEHLMLYKEADLLYRSHQLKQAKSAFFKALALAPRESDTLWALGSCFSELGQPHHAERYFRFARAGADWKDRSDLLYNIANALFDQGRLVAALKLYKKVPKSSEAFLPAKKNISLVRRRLIGRKGAQNQPAHLLS